MDFNARHSPCACAGETRAPAARDGHVEVVRLLLQPGADPTAMDHGGATAVHAAVVSRKPGRAKVLSLLLRSSGADIEARTDDGLTPLHYLCANPSVTAKMIIATYQFCPAAAVQQDNEGNTPLHRLCMNPRATPSAVEALFDAAPAAASRSLRATPRSTFAPKTARAPQKRCV